MFYYQIPVQKLSLAGLIGSASSRRFLYGSVAAKRNLTTRKFSAETIIANYRRSQGLRTRNLNMDSGSTAANNDSEGLAVGAKSLSAETCPGCGSLFQNHSPFNAGYLPPLKLTKPRGDEEVFEDREALDKRLAEIEASTEPISVKELNLLLTHSPKFKKPKTIICRRCHSKKSGSNFGPSITSTVASPQSNKLQFSQLKISSDGALIILMVDLMDLTNSLINNAKLAEAIGVGGNRKLLVVLNKMDAMPEGFNFKGIEKWMKKKMDFNGGDGGILDVFCISTTTGENMDRFSQILLTQSKSDDCYMIGNTNAGKSSLLNYFKTKMGHSDLVTVAPTSGTTAGLVKVKFDQAFRNVLGRESLKEKESMDAQIREEKGTESASSNNEIIKEYSLYDTAGLIHPQQLCHLIPLSHMKWLAPKEKLKEKLVQLEKNSASYWIGGLVRVDIERAYLDPIVSGCIKFIVPPKIPIHNSSFKKFPKFNEVLARLSPMLFPRMPNKLSHSDKVLVTEANSESKEGDTKGKALKNKKKGNTLKVKEFQPLPQLKTGGSFQHTNDNSIYFISGVGWFSILSASRMSVTVHTPEGMGVKVIKDLKLSTTT